MDKHEENEQNKEKKVLNGASRINNMVFTLITGLCRRKRMGQRLEVDLDMSYPIETAVQHDELTETVSYADVYDTTKEFLKATSLT